MFIAINYIELDFDFFLQTEGHKEHW